jgi:HEAT repeat protein
MLPAVGGADTHAASGPLVSVAHELVRVMTTPGSPRLQAESAEALQTIPYEDARSALRSALADRYVPGRLWALSTLFFMDDDGQFDAARVRYLGSVEDALLDPLPDARRAVSSVAIAMQIRPLPPQAVPVLAALLQSREPAVRRAAASALGDIESWRAVRSLATLALDDDDAEVWSQAAAGLARITGEGPSGKATGDGTLRYWRNWAKANLR